MCAAKGFQANGIYCGIKQAMTNSAEEIQPEKLDLGLIYAEKPCRAAAMYTTNQVQGAPLALTRKHLENDSAQAIIVNSVNANTCNADGLEVAEQMAKLTAEALQLPENEIIVASTGVIGQKLPIEPIQKGIPELVKGLCSENHSLALNAMMTTDTMPKEVAVEFTLQGKICRLGGMLKGSGMIHPNMATTLTFVTTDCHISADMLKLALHDVVPVTLNHVSVDGDTSTNDMICLLADGLAENPEIQKPDTDFEQFKDALYTVLMNLSRMMARDGEGATKLIECFCTGAENDNTAEILAKSVITSNLFKAAMFGADANWGRVLCALGYAPVKINIPEISVSFASSAGKIDVCRNGEGIAFSEEQAKKILSEEEILVLLNVGTGTGKAVVWGCDLTYDYVRINGDYRS